jgi:Flp pilus assembly pilin Flp
MYQSRRLLDEEDGATAIEYAFLLALITLVAVATLEKLGTGSKNAFQAVDDAFVIR